jgi:regulator of sigma E protease
MKYLIPAALATALIAVLYGPGLLATIAIFLGILFFLVIMHELGHFTVAKLSGIQVLEFGLGMPPKVFSFKRGETEYSFNLLPIGGFVRMLGEEDPSAPRSIASQSAWKRLAVLAAGPGMNAVLPIFLLAAAFMIPRAVTITDVVVVSVVPGGPADRAGVEAGDIIREVQGDEVLNSTSVQAGIQTRLGADMQWTVEREGQLIELTIPQVRANPPAGEGATGVSLANGRVSVESVQPGSIASSIGLQPGDTLLRIDGRGILDADQVQVAIDAAIAQDPSDPISVEVLRDGQVVQLTMPADAESLGGVTLDVRPEESRSLGPIAAIPAAFEQLVEILITFRNEIGRMISGAAPVEFAGPVGIAQLTGQVAEAGLGPLVTWAALLSINLAIINILPLPALDGGRITFVLLELVRGGRRIAPEKERLVHMLGFAFLMAMIVLVTANDLQRIFSGGSLFT